MSICEWFISWLLPLVCDVSLLPEQTLTDIRTSFALVFAFCAISLLIWCPYKLILYLLRGGKKKKL